MTKKSMMKRSWRGICWFRVCVCVCVRVCVCACVCVCVCVCVYCKCLCSLCLQSEGDYSWHHGRGSTGSSEVVSTASIVVNGNLHMTDSVTLARLYKLELVATSNLKHIIMHALAVHGLYQNINIKIILANNTIILW